MMTPLIPTYVALQDEMVRTGNDNRFPGLFKLVQVTSLKAASDPPRGKRQRQLLKQLWEIYASMAGYVSGEREHFMHFNDSQGKLIDTLLLSLAST